MKVDLDLAVNSIDMKDTTEQPDPQQEYHDTIDPALENKLMNNLQLCMLFFCFNQISDYIKEQNEFEDELAVPKHFIRHWKKFVKKNIISEDLKMINEILNTPKNVFYAALQNPNAVTDSTETYQEKYDQTLNKIEKFFMDTIQSKDKDEE